MNQDKLKSMIDGIGLMSEVTLIFFRNALSAGASMEEATRLTQAFISAMVWGAMPGDKKEEK